MLPSHFTFQQSYSIFASSTHRRITISPSHHITISPYHQITISPCHLVTLFVCLHKEIKTGMEEEEPKVYTRRKFFRRLSLPVIGLAGLASIPFVISSLIPRKVIENNRILIGKSDDFPINQMTFLPQPRLYILRDHEGIAAMSAICTHLGCVVVKDASGFLCPCHGSSYSIKGIVLTGPAPRSLPWYRINGMPDGNLTANLDKKVSPETRFAV